MQSVVRRLLSRSAPLTLAVIVAACSDASNPTQAPIQELYTTPTGLVTANPPEIFSGAGDMGTCNNNNDEATAKLLDNLPGKVFILGDNVYENGTTSEYNNCYNPTWGRHKSRTHPSAGNHDYNTSGASGYYAYFGAAAGDPSKGYYSFNLGAWHVVVLNSNISKSSSSAQVTWLRNDLAANQNLCTVAYFHHPMYSSSGGTGSGGVTYSSVRPFYDALYAGGADLVLAGHRHFYERLAPIKPDGTRDNVYGTRHIIAGMGGKGGGSVSNKFPTSEVANGNTFGVLKLYLYDDSYAWKFIPVAGKTFTDSGSTACHGPPGSPPPPPPGVSASLSTVSAAPASVTAGSGTATVTVTARNANGQPVSGATVTLASSGSLNTLTQPGPTDANGVATGTIRSTVAQPKIISATINSVGITQTDTVTVVPDVPAGLFFTGQPSTTAAGASITPAVQVAVQDQFGNQVTGATTDVTLTIGTNPSGGTLSGSTTVAAVAGVATFSNLSINAAGNGYRLSAASSGLTGANSSAFNITPPGVSASQSTVTAAPATIAAGSNTATITVTARDANGNPISGATVTLSASGSGNTLTQPAETTNANGEATGTLSSSLAQAKVVSATINGIGITQTATVTVVPAAPAALAFTVQPSTTQEGAPITPAVQVTVNDQFGNRVTGATNDVTLTISTNPGGGALSGTATVAASGGLATFSDLSINVAGNGYVLSAAADALTGATSSAFSITAPSQATALAFAVQPANTVVRGTISPAVQVSLNDQFGNRVTSATNDVTLTISTNPGGGTLSGTTTVAAVSGLATFNNLSIDAVGNGYRLTAAASGLTSATSSTFNITAPPVSASQSTVTAAPVTITAGSNTATITVTARDASGNPIGGATVTLTASGTGNTLTQPTGPTNANGVATGTIGSTVAQAKVVSATVNGVGITQTATVTVAPGVAAALAFTVQPSLTEAGTTILPAVQVGVNDQFGNRVTNATNNVTMTIGTNPGGGTLSGTTTVAASAGLATFNNLSINAAGNGYRLAAAASGLTSATSSTFNITPAGVIAPTVLTAGQSLTNGTAYTTASITPSPNKLVTIAVMGTRSYGASASPTITGGGMSAWTEVTSVTFDPDSAPLRRMTVYRAMSAAPGSGPLTITWSQNQSNTQWIVLQWSGVETSGTNGAGAIGQVGSNRGDAVNGLTVSLPAFSNNRNAAYGVFGVRSGSLSISPGAGFTELSEQLSSEGGPSSDLQAQWATFVNTIAATWTNLTGGALGIEIKARPLP